MRVKISTNPPLPPVKAWFPLGFSSGHSDVSTPTISSFKSILCTSLPAFHGVEPSSLHLSIDGFELLDDSELAIVRDGDLICVDSLHVPSVDATVQHHPVVGPSVSQATQTPLAPATPHEREQRVSSPESCHETESSTLLSTSGSSPEIVDLPTSTPVHSIRNVVVVGEAGIGKSSLINLVTGMETAITGNDALGITNEAECHKWDVDSTQTLRLWDTPGLSEGSFGSVSPKEALSKLRSLFTKLKREGGVHLVVHCMRGLPHVTKGMKKIYEDITTVRDEAAANVPLVAVITGLEEMSGLPDIITSMEQWWEDNGVTLSNFKMLFSGHACITTLPDDCDPQLPTRRRLCQDFVRRLIIWGTLPVRNVVIAGEIGSGKSSLINLVLGSEQATVVHGLRNDAGTTNEYDLNIDNQVIRLWDTPGLQGSEPHNNAEKVLRSLLVDLNKRGGTHLLIICIPRNLKVTETRKVYGSIMQMRERLCSTAPVFAVITGLEDLVAEPDAIASMERWWEDNLMTFSELKMFFPGHACITTLSDKSDSNRHELCQQLVRRLIAKGVLLRNAVVAGEIGAAKSSLINLVLSSERAATAHGLTACTEAISPYDVGINNQLIRLWDTPGLWDEPCVDAERAQKALRSLFTDLSKKGGVHLLVVCVNVFSNTMARTKKVYDEIMRMRNIFCPNTPVVLVISGLEDISAARPDAIASMEEWWQHNMLSSFNGSSAHACITTFPDNCPPEMPGRREACQMLVWNLITEYSISVAV